MTQYLGMSGHSVHISTVANPDDEDQQVVVVDLVDDPIVTDAHAPLRRSVYPGQSLNAIGPRLDLEGVERAHDSALDICAELRELATRRWGEFDSIGSVGHATAALRAEFAFDLLQGDRRGVLELGKCFLRHSHVVLVLRALEEFDLLHRDDRRDRFAAAGDEHSLVAVRDSIDDVCERLARLADADVAALVLVA